MLLNFTYFGGIEGLLLSTWILVICKLFLTCVGTGILLSLRLVLVRSSLQDSSVLASVSLVIELFVFVSLCCESNSVDRWLVAFRVSVGRCGEKAESRLLQLPPYLICGVWSGWRRLLVFLDRLLCSRLWENLLIFSFMLTFWNIESSVNRSLDAPYLSDNGCLSELENE